MLLIQQSVQCITYVFEIIPLLLKKTLTYLLTNILLIIYYILFIHQYIYSSNYPYYMSASLVQISLFVSIRNHTSHILPTPIILPSNKNTRALVYIYPKLWNSLPPYIRYIQSHNKFKKYIQQFISGSNL